MRTTIELPNSLRAKLLELAARRGEKGFSHLIREAVEQYLATGAPDKRSAEDSLGSLNKAQAEELEASVQRLRQRWR